MRIFRWLEPICGVAVIIPGAWNVAHLLIFPAYAGESCQAPTNPEDPPVCTATHASFLEVNGASGVVNLGIIACLLLAIAGAAIVHARGGSRGARTALWLLTGGLVVYTILAILSIGSLLLPSAALALLTSLAAIGNRPARA